MERISSYYSLEHLVTTLDEQGVPEEYICPITQDFMRDPCIAEDGHTYERAAIEEWLSRHGTSPITREYISSERLMPDPTLRKMIDEFLGEKREMLLSQREREQSQRPTSLDLNPEDGHAPIAPGVPASQTQSEGGKEVDDVDDKEDDDYYDDATHPYTSGRTKAERQPLIAPEELRPPRASRAIRKQHLTRGDRDPRSAIPPSVDPRARRTKRRTDASSRSSHSGEEPFAHDRTSARASCWMCVLY